MAAVTILNAGTYSVEIDVGFLIDGFTLDDPVKGLLDSPDYVLDGSTSFADVTEGVLNLNVRRGRQDPADQFAVGSMSFTLNDTYADGLFNPFDNDPSNPYYDQALGIPGLAPGRQVRLIRYDNTSTPETLFAGFVVNYDYHFALGGLDTVNVYCADNMYRLASTTISAHNPTQELTGARVTAILDRAEVDYPTGAARNIATGTVTLGGGSGGGNPFAIEQGTNVKAYFDQITDTAERGRIFVDREGVLVSQNRIGITLASPVATFSDTGTGVKYNDLAIDFKAEDIVNRAEVTRLGGATQVAQDVASQTQYLIRTLSITNSLLSNNTQAADLADYLLFPQPEPRFTAVQSWFGSLTTTHRDTLATIDIGDIIAIEKTIQVGNTPTLRTEALAVEGVEHRITFDQGHTTKFYTSPTVIAYELLLDDLVFGRLDENNVLG
jgi:hypothetical protein